MIEVTVNANGSVPEGTCVLVDDPMAPVNCRHSAERPALVYPAPPPPDAQPLQVAASTALGAQTEAAPAGAMMTLAESGNTAAAHVREGVVEDDREPVGRGGDRVPRPREDVAGGLRGEGRGRRADERAQEPVRLRPREGDRGRARRHEGSARPRERAASSASPCTTGTSKLAGEPREDVREGPEGEGVLEDGDRSTSSRSRSSSAPPARSASSAISAPPTCPGAGRARTPRR